MTPRAPVRFAAFAFMLAILAASRAQKPQFAITGTLLNATTGDAIPNAHLIALTADEHNCPGSHTNSAEATSDPQGAFHLPIPCAGIWHLQASGTGFAAQDYEQHEAFYTGIVLTPAQPTFAVHFSVTPVSAINGFVLDEAGEAVRDARLTLLNANLTASQQQPTPLASATSDDRGFYEFPNLLTGSYLIAVQAQPWYAAAAGNARNASQYGDPNLDLTYPITYFPGTADPLAASAITLAPGATQQADIRLSPVPSIHITLSPGERTGAMFGRVQGGVIPLTRGGNPSAIELVTPFGTASFQPTNISPNPDGSVDIAGFAPGTYQFAESRGRGRGRDSEDSVRTITLGKDAPHTVAVLNGVDAAPASPTPAAFVHLSGSASFHAAPAAGTMVLLVAAAAPDVAGHFKVFRAQSNTDGSFNFPHVPVGNYILVAIQNGWSMAWAEPATLSTFLVLGVPVQLTGSTTLTHPVQAQ